MKITLHKKIVLQLKAKAKKPGLKKKITDMNVIKHARKLNIEL